MKYPDTGPRTLSPREIAAMTAQCITAVYHDDMVSVQEILARRSEVTL